jgi:hypothetical protein
MDGVITDKNESFNLDKNITKYAKHEYYRNNYFIINIIALKTNLYSINKYCTFKNVH